MKRLWLLALLLAGMASRASAEDRWLGGLSSGTRLRSMGGCFAAASDAGDALLFNPAGLAHARGGTGFSLRLDPTAPIAFRPREATGDWPWAKVLPALSVVRQVAWRGSRLCVALGTSEWQPDSMNKLPGLGEEARPSSSALAPALALALALDERVRVGSTLTAWFDHVQERRRLGVSYGVLIRANRFMDVGAHAAYFPAGAASARSSLDRMGDGTINVGVAWQPFGRASGRMRGNTLLVAMDVRNVTQDAGLAGSQELHLGAEALWRGHMALRGGMQWPNENPGDGGPRVSGGLGWRGAFLKGMFQADLGLMQDPLRGGDRLWMAGLGWSP